ncbi:kinase-like domain-containing protein [Daldinia vernicosa]|uniref:kinase-like domain-containing protein n=1 Tax=Daldinia vernicosa TaxID=114800 RepID=UPI002007BCD5|nr:kinase-like domain-containing protein [Daldinia vernicosa]KAI0848084.1 kinase-like domain-containing protein [Daldinia vernicosa]
MAYLADTTFAGWPTVRYAELVTLDQFTPRVHLVQLASSPETRLVVKYISRDMAKGNIWKEMNILKTQQLHPSILPVDRLILDNNNIIVGMGIKFVPGGNLNNNKDRTFKLKWLKQLTETLDFLHFKQGIVHGDIHMGNILIDEAADRLVLCDFSMVKEATEQNLMDEFWSVMWTLYELITLDFKAEEEQVQNSQRENGVYSLNTESIEGLPSWPVKGKLDCDAETFRSYLQEWIKKRRENLRSVQARKPEVRVNISEKGRIQWAGPIHGCPGAQSRTVRMNYQH